MTPGQDVEEDLGALGISFTRHDHPAVATVAEAEQHWAGIDALHCKNLFLRNQKGTRHFLIVLAIARRGDLAAIGELFGSASRVRVTGTAGHVSRAHAGISVAVRLINDRERRVEVAIDVAVRDAARVAFHPNVNTATLVVTGADFQRFLTAVGHDVQSI